MNPYYIDTCSLKWRYLSGAPTSDVNTIVDSTANNIFITELTILEWSSAFAVAVRTAKIDYKIFKENELALFTDIAQERLKIFQLKRVISRARDWIEYIGAVKKLALRTNDAIHLVTAIELSSQLGEKIEFITSDTKLFNIVDSIPEFKPHLNARFFAP